MMARRIGFALHQRFATLALAVLLVGVGMVAFERLPIEAYPDVADVQVDVITLWPGHAAEEIERYITIPLEKEINGVARLTFIRSVSLFGLSNIHVLMQAEVPNDARPSLGPLASVIGEIYRYTLESKTMSLVELKVLQDWVLEREFRKVAGVADVGSWGGGIKQYQIAIEPDRLRAYDLTLKQVGGLVSATAMTLLVLPAVYDLFARAHERRRRLEITP